MDSFEALSVTNEFRAAVRTGSTGTVVRLVRQAQGLTQAKLGHRIGYSPSAVSRLESGRLRVRDIVILRRLATALGVPPQVFGVSDVECSTRTSTAVRVGASSDLSGGEMRRRRLLVGAAGLAGSTLLFTDAFANPARPATVSALGELERACLHPAPARDITLAAGQRRFSTANADFAAGRYASSARQLATIVSGAAALMEHSAAGPEPLSLLAHTYALATEILVKVGGRGIAMMTADRAVVAARQSESPIAFAAAARQLATVLRQGGHLDSSIHLALEAIDRLRDGGIRMQDSLAVYRRSLCTAAYIAAHAANRELAHDLLNEASHAPSTTPAGPGEFNSEGVALYAIGVHYALGDASGALTAASRIEPGHLPSAERRARYWCDMARAWSQYGSPERTFAALVAAYREVPGEVQDRSSMRRLLADLVRHDRRLPGVRTFAGQVGALD